MNRILREPAVISGAIVAILNAVVLFGVDLTAEQIAGVNVAVIAVLTVITRIATTPSAEVVARVAPGDPTVVAGPALEGVPNGTPVDVDTIPPGA